MGNSETPIEIAPSQSQLGQPTSAPGERELSGAVRGDQQVAVRKACAMMRVCSSVVAAIAVHPGVSAPPEAIDAATADLVSQATKLTEAAYGIAVAHFGAAALAGQKNLLRQQAAEFVSAQWRIGRAVGAPTLDLDRVTEIFKQLVADGESEVEETQVAVAGVVAAKRLALLSVVPDMYQAICAFDYFVPEPGALMQTAVRSVVNAAESGVARLTQTRGPSEVYDALAPALIARLGAIYTAHYRSLSRATVLDLQSMDDDARLCHLTAHRLTGLPVDGVEAGFQRLADRLIGMVADAVPELAWPASQKPGGTSPAPGSSVHHENPMP